MLTGTRNYLWVTYLWVIYCIFVASNNKCKKQYECTISIRNTCH